MYFEIGVWKSKHEVNIGTLWRSAYQLGASGIFTVGQRYKNQASDTVNAWRNIPYRRYNDITQLIDNLPYSCQLVGVEMGGYPLQEFVHPDRCFYLLGAEDHGLSEQIASKCHKLVSLPSVRTRSYNVAVAGSLVMYDRFLKEDMKLPIPF